MTNPSEVRDTLKLYEEAFERASHHLTRAREIMHSILGRDGFRPGFKDMDELLKSLTEMVEKTEVKTEEDRNHKFFAESSLNEIMKHAYTIDRTGRKFKEVYLKQELGR
ncbi:MAG: hypothetical protein ACPLRS_02835, partial [Hydrogenobacter sp.]